MYSKMSKILSIILWCLLVLGRQMATAIDPVVLVHGGTGNFLDERDVFQAMGIVWAAGLGYHKLLETNNVLDAVEEAVRSMESNEYFNAGYGAFLTSEGNVELDASIMDGRNLNAGCVTTVRDIMHPISVARRVMEKSVHTFLSGDGVNNFARNQSFEILPPGSLVTEYAQEALEAWRKNSEYGGMKFTGYEFSRNYSDFGTVGAVAIDAEGNIAVATSSGGITGKVSGRVGETPILGAGAYADNRFGGVSTTGHGDTIMRHNLAQQILARIRYLNEDATNATPKAILEMSEEVTEPIGAIAIDKNGKIGIYSTAEKMAWAYQRGKCIYSGVHRSDYSYVCEQF